MVIFAYSVGGLGGDGCLDRRAQWITDQVQRERARYRRAPSFVMANHVTTILCCHASG
jgi:hypothetical protein